MSLLQSPTIHFRHFLQLWHEILADFLFRDTAKRGILWQETDIGQIVECREQGNLRKLGDAGDKDEALVLIVSLQNGEHVSIHIGTFFMLRSFPGMLQRRVVFIDEYDNLHARLPISCGNDGIKAIGKLRGRIRRYGILLFIRLKAQIEIRADSFSTGSSTAHVESDDWILLPVIFHIHDLETFKEFLSAAEISFQSIYEHRLAESARAAQIVILVTIVCQLPDDVCLINIDVSLFPDFLERLYAYRQSSSFDVCHILFLHIYFMQRYKIFSYLCLSEALFSVSSQFLQYGIVKWRKKGMRHKFMTHFLIFMLTENDQCG